MWQHLKPSTLLTSSTQYLSICSYLWQLQLLPKSSCPKRHPCPCPQDNRTACLFRTTRSRWLVHRPFAWPLLLLQLLHTINIRHPRRNRSGLVSTPNPFSQIHNGWLLNQYRQGHVGPHPTKTSTNQKKPTPLLMYGSKLLNAYTEMSKLLQRAPKMTETPQVPAPPPRVDTPTKIEEPQNIPSP